MFWRGGWRPGAPLQPSACTTSSPIPGGTARIASTLPGLWGQTVLVLWPGLEPLGSAVTSQRRLACCPGFERNVGPSAGSPSPGAMLPVCRHQAARRDVRVQVAWCPAETPQIPRGQGSSWSPIRGPRWRLQARGSFETCSIQTPKPATWASDSPKRPWLAGMPLVPSSKACSQTEGAGPCGLSQKSAWLCWRLPQLHVPRGMLTTVPVTRGGGAAHRHGRGWGDGGWGSGTWLEPRRGGGHGGPIFGGLTQARAQVTCLGSLHAPAPWQVPAPTPCAQGQERSGCLREPSSASRTFLGRRPAACEHVLRLFRPRKLCPGNVPRGQKTVKGSWPRHLPRCACPWPCSHDPHTPAGRCPPGTLLLTAAPLSRGTCS